MSSATDPATDGRAIRGQATRDRIVDAAREVLVEEGHGGTTTRAVADRAGVRLSLVHYHFGGKQGLLVEVLQRETDQLLARQRELFTAPIPLSEKWRTACELLDEDIASGYVRLLWELWAAGLADPALAEGWRASARGWRGLIESTVADWAQELGVELPLSARALSSLVGTVFHGIEVELLAGVSERESPHHEVLNAIGALIERAEKS
jgi:AcrR family transcriptional regulator